MILALYKATWAGGGTANNAVRKLTNGEHLPESNQQPLGYEPSALPLRQSAVTKNTDNYTVSHGARKVGTRTDKTDGLNAQRDTAWFAVRELRTGGDGAKP